MISCTASFETKSLFLTATPRDNCKSMFEKFHDASLFSFTQPPTLSLTFTFPPLWPHLTLSTDFFSGPDPVGAPERPDACQSWLKAESGDPGPDPGPLPSAAPLRFWYLHHSILQEEGLWSRCAKWHWEPTPAETALLPVPVPIVYPHT